MMTVKATREGLIGGRTASGYIVDQFVPFVALPSHRALGRAVRLMANGNACDALVLDVGPWNIADDSYVFDGHRPASEADERTNGAGIDLSEAVWRALRMSGNNNVQWEFCNKE